MGELLLCSGAEVKRVENTIVRLGRAYGACRMDVFAITSSIVVTMSFEDGQEVTQTRRIQNPGRTDLDRLEKLNSLSRECCEKRMEIEKFREKFLQIKEEPVSSVQFYGGSMLGTAAFTVFFGGTLYDAAAAACFAVFVCFLQRKLSPRCPNTIIFNLLTSLIIGTGIYGVAGVLPFLQVDKVLIGDIMLLIPGIALTNAVKDMLVGDTIAGAMRFLESLTWAGALAAGFMAVIWMMGG